MHTHTHTHARGLILLLLSLVCVATVFFEPAQFSSKFFTTGSGDAGGSIFFTGSGDAGGLIFSTGSGDAGGDNGLIFTSGDAGGSFFASGSVCCMFAAHDELFVFNHLLLLVVSRELIGGCFIFFRFLHSLHLQLRVW